MPSDVVTPNRPTAVVQVKAMVVWEGPRRGYVWSPKAVISPPEGYTPRRFSPSGTETWGPSLLKMVTENALDCHQPWPRAFGGRIFCHYEVLLAALSVPQPRPLSYLRCTHHSWPLCPPSQSCNTGRTCPRSRRSPFEKGGC
jgi:hypothetical protein